MTEFPICTVCGSINEQTETCGCYPVGRFPRVRFVTSKKAEGIRWAIAQRLTNKINQDEKKDTDRPG